jgi:hypothetical protein
VRIANATEPGTSGARVSLSFSNLAPASAPTAAAAQAH